MNKSKVFIGSSKEGLKYAKIVQLNLSRLCETKIWSQGVFGLGKGYLEDLVSSLDDFDFAILVLTPDDLLVSRDVKTQSPRDNVIFELGLFIGKLGRHRTYIVHDRTKEMKFPSDLDGITMASFEVHDKQNLQSALGPCCTKIELEIEKHGFRNVEGKDSIGLNDKIKTPYYHNFINELIEDFSIIDKVGDSLFEEYVKIDCDEFASAADKWKQSTLMIPQENYDGFLIDAYEKAEKSVFSTSIKEYMSIWQEPFGGRLLDAHEKSSAKVTRVFVFDIREDVNENFVSIMKDQENFGIEVLIFIDKEYPGFNFPTDLSKDFTVLDNGKIIGKTVTFGKSRNAEWIFNNEKESNKFKRYMDRLIKGSIKILDL